MQRIFHAAASRGCATLDGLTSYRSFSFADHDDPQRRGFGALRVLNEEVLAPGKNIPLHAHENVEIVSIPLSGRLNHRDSRGCSHLIATGDVHVLSAGRGVTHWECNDSPAEPAHYLQLWIQPQSQGNATRYGQGTLAGASIAGRFGLAAAPSGCGAVVDIDQQAYVSLAVVEAGVSISYRKYLPGSGIYLFLIAGNVQVGTDQLIAGDGLGLTGSSAPDCFALELATLLCVEVPMPETAQAKSNPYPI